MLDRARRLARRLRYLRKAGIRKRIRDIVLRDGAASHTVRREDLARLYLAGDGIEIGALTWPMRTPPGARVRYVDHATRDELIAAYGRDFAKTGSFANAVPETDVVDEAERLATFGDASLDFVIANHVLEHVEDPLGALGSMLRVLRPGGILFLSLPDARETFDARRPRTTVEHALRDHREGPAVSRRSHYEEWARDIEGKRGADVAARAAEFATENARHHFHVWELDGFLELIRASGLPCRLELGQVNHEEFVVILRRT